MDLHKSLCDEIGLNPDDILLFAEILQYHREYSRALEIIEEHLETNESFWGKREQCRAYGLIAMIYRKNMISPNQMFISNVNFCPLRRKRIIRNQKLRRCMDSGRLCQRPPWHTWNMLW